MKQTLTRTQLIFLKDKFDCLTWKECITQILIDNVDNISNDFEIIDDYILKLSDEGTDDQIKNVNDLGIIFPKTNSEEYLENHNKSSIKVGDRIKLIRTAKSYESGWVSTWNKTCMDKYVGSILIVLEDIGIIGFRCKSQENEEVYTYPYFVLEKVINEYIPFDFNDDLVGKYIISKDKSAKGIITYQGENNIEIGNNCKTYKYILDHYTFLDKTPCGKLKQ